MCFVDMIVADEEWLRGEFDAIIAAEDWGEPLAPGSPAPTARHPAGPGRGDVAGVAEPDPPGAPTPPHQPQAAERSPPAPLTRR